jgi:hypothetical protein
MVKVLHSSKYYCKWALASSLGLPQKWASLYHRNEASFDLEVFVLGVDLGACGHLISRGSRVLAESLLDVGVCHRS